MEIKVKIGNQNIVLDGVGKVFSDSLDKDFICNISTGRNNAKFGINADEAEGLFDWAYSSSKCEKRLVITGEDKATVIDRDIIESIELERVRK